MDVPLSIPDITLIRRVGQGSYGEVWLARTLTGVYRAVKVVLRSRFEDDGPFLREFDGITRFQRAVGDRPKQLALMHVGRDEARGLFYYVMELADDVERGTDIDPERYQPLTLKEHLRRRGAMPASEVVRLGIVLAEALVELHAAALVHRDVKPSNIIFVAGSPKLADIGLVSSSDHTITSLGTPGYAPPEGAGTAQADVYGVGKILYELMTGLAPQEFPRLPAEVVTRGDASALIELNEVILRACDPRPAERYATADHLLQDLRWLQAGRSVREFRRLRARLQLLGRVGLAAASFALVALGALGWINLRQARALGVQERLAREQAEHDERLARYAADVHLAHLGWASGDFGLARTALRRHATASDGIELRGLEWQMLWADTRGEQVQTVGEAATAAVVDFRLAPGGRAAVVQRLGGATEWTDLTTGGRTTLLDAGRGLGGFAPAGERFFVGTEQRTVQVFDARTIQPLGSLGAHGRLVAASGDGRVLALGELAADGPLVRFWDSVADEPLGEWRPAASPGRPPPELIAAGLSADGRWYASAHYEAAAAGHAYTVVGWDVAAATERFRSRVERPVRTLVFRAEGDLLAVGRSDGIIDLLATESGAIVRQLHTEGSWISAVGFRPGARELAAGLLDGRILRWSFDEPGREPIAYRGHELGVTALSWSTDGRVLWSASADGTLRQWQGEGASAPNLVGRFWSGTQGNLRLSGDGEWAAVTDAQGRLAIVSLVRREVVQTLEAVFQPLAWPRASGRLLAQRADGALVDVSVADGGVDVLLELERPRDGVVALAATADAGTAAIGWIDGDVTVWQRASGTAQRLGNGRGSPVRALAMDPAGAWFVSGHLDGRLHHWSIGTGDRRTLPAAVPVPVVSMVALPGGRGIAVGLEDGRIRIVDGQSGELVTELSGHAKAVTDLCLAPDGRRLLSGDSSGYITSWTTDTWRSVGTLRVLPSYADQPAAAGAYRLAFAADGSRLAVLAEDGRVRAWDLAAAAAISGEWDSRPLASRGPAPDEESRGAASRRGR